MRGRVRARAGSMGFIIQGVLPSPPEGGQLSKQAFGPASGPLLVSSFSVRFVSSYFPVCGIQSVAEADLCASIYRCLGPSLSRCTPTTRKTINHGWSRRRGGRLLRCCPSQARGAHGQERTEGADQELQGLQHCFLRLHWRCPVRLQPGNVLGCPRDARLPEAYVARRERYPIQARWTVSDKAQTWESTLRTKPRRVG